MGSRRVTILMYHYVRVLCESRYPDVKGLEVNQFYEQLSYLENYYTFISIQELISAIESGEELPPKSVLLTFNDSYKDHFKNVFPVLDSKGIEGCFYPEIAAVKEQKVILNHKIHFILAAATGASIVVKTIFSWLDTLRDEFELEANSAYFDKLAVASTYDSKETIFIKRLLQVELHQKVSTIIADHLFDQFVGVSEKVFAQELYLNEEQINCMFRNGMHFGLLGYNHPRYDKLDPVEQQKELQKASDYLIALGGKETTLTASYPWGAYDKNTLDILQKLDCKVAFTTNAGVADLDINNPLELPRIDTKELPTKTDASPNRWYKIA